MRETMVADTTNKKKGNTASNIRMPKLLPSTNSPDNRILHLQRIIGNQAMQQLIKSEAPQPKLKTGRVNAMYGQEVDRVAQQSMTMPKRTPLHGTKRLRLQLAPAKLCNLILNKLKTDKVKNAPRKYYGASFNHTFFPYLPEGCSITGFQVSEAVSTVRNDFRIAVKNVPLGKNIWTITKQNKLHRPDLIWTLAGPNGLGVNPIRNWPAVLDQNQIWYYRRSPNHNWQLGPGIIIKVTLSGDLKRKESLKVTTTDHAVSRTEPYRGPKIRIRK